MQLREWGPEQRGARASEHAKMQPMCHVSASYHGVWGSVADWRRRARGKNKALAKRSITQNVQSAGSRAACTTTASRLSQHRHVRCCSKLIIGGALQASSGLHGQGLAPGLCIYACLHCLQAQTSISPVSPTRRCQVLVMMIFMQPF